MAGPGYASAATLYTTFTAQQKCSSQPLPYGSTTINYAVMLSTWSYSFPTVGREWKPRLLRQPRPTQVHWCTHLPTPIATLCSTSRAQKGTVRGYSQSDTRATTADNGHKLLLQHVQFFHTNMSGLKARGELTRNVDAPAMHNPAQQ